MLESLTVVVLPGLSVQADLEAHMTQDFWREEA